MPVAEAVRVVTVPLANIRGGTDLAVKHGWYRPNGSPATRRSAANIERGDHVEVTYSSGRLLARTNLGGWTEVSCTPGQAVWIQRSLSLRPRVATAPANRGAGAGASSPATTARASATWGEGSMLNLPASPHDTDELAASGATTRQHAGHGWYPAGPAPASRGPDGSWLGRGASTPAGLPTAPMRYVDGRTSESVRRLALAKFDEATGAQQDSGPGSQAAGEHSSAVVVVTVPGMDGSPQARQFASDVRARGQGGDPGRWPAVVEISCDRDGSTGVARKMAMGAIREVWRRADERWRLEHPHHAWTRVRGVLSALARELRVRWGQIVSSHPFGNPMTLGDIAAYRWQQFWGPVANVKFNIWPFMVVETRPGTPSPVTAAQRAFWEAMFARACRAARNRGGDVVVVVRNAQRTTRNELHMVTSIFARMHERKLPGFLVLWGSEHLEPLLTSVSVAERAAANMLRIFHLSREQFGTDMLATGAIRIDDAEPEAIANVAYHATTRQMFTGGRPLDIKRVWHENIYRSTDGNVYTEAGLLAALETRKQALATSGKCPAERQFDFSPRDDGAIVVTWHTEAPDNADIYLPLNVEVGQVNGETQMLVTVGGERVMDPETNLCRIEGGEVVPGLFVDPEGRIVTRGHLDDTRAVIAGMHQLRAVEPHLTPAIVMARFGFGAAMVSRRSRATPATPLPDAVAATVAHERRQELSLA